jgi:hypothetical protein
MIWRIFRKDLKLSWLLALVVAGFHGIWPTFMMLNHYILSGPIVAWSNIQIVGNVLATAFLITIVVQQDSVPGVRQDWLVRPIRRSDLMLAKLVYAIVVVQFPVFAMDAIENLGTGSSFSSAIGAAAMHSLMQLLMFDLLFLALASVTANLLEAVSGAAIGGLAIGLTHVIIQGLSPSSSPLLLGSTLAWIQDASLILVLFIGSVAILSVQYLRRRTGTARAGAVGTFAVCVAATLMPWKVAYGVQRSILSEPSGRNTGVGISFDPTAPKYHPEGGLTRDDAIAILNQDSNFAYLAQLQAHLPINVTGLQVDSAVQADYSQIRLIEPGGQATSLQLSRWNLQRDKGGPDAATVYPALTIPAALYKKVREEPVRIEMETWLTVLKMVSSDTLAALNGDRRISSLGWCRTNINNAQTASQLSCLATQLPPPCMAIYLRYRPSGEHNPERFGCTSYSPLIINPVWPDALARSGGALPFRDPTGLAHFPVDGSKLSESDAVIDTYRIEAHRQQTLTIPQIRLSDWENDTP